MLAVPKGQQKGNLNDRYDACIQKPAQYLGVKKDAWSAQCPKQLVGVAFVFQIAETGGEHCHDGWHHDDIEQGQGMQQGLCSGIKGL